MTLLSRLLSAITSQQLDWEDVNRALGSCPIGISCAWLDGEGELPEEVAKRVEGVVKGRGAG